VSEATLRARASKETTISTRRRVSTTSDKF